MKRILIYDDYNSRFLQDQDCIGTITCNVGVSAPRNGFKIIEIDGMKDAQPLKRRRTEEERRRRHLYGDKGATFSKGKESYIGNDGIANTVTTVFSKDNIIAEIMESNEKLTQNALQGQVTNKRYRIRKLTPRECFRLMDLIESDIDKIQNAGISESQQYRMAGNSIVVSCMVGIFKNLFCEESEPQTGQLTLF